MTALRGPDQDPAGRLAAVPGMAGGRVLQRLSDGPTNASFLVEQAGEHFVLRLDKAEAVTLGLDRQNERAVCAAVAAAGLAPAYRHFDPASGICLRPFVAGRSLRRADLEDRAILQRLAAALRSLHGLTPIGAAFDPVAAVRRYAKQLGTPVAAALAERAAELHAELARDGASSALCHNDLVCENAVLAEGQGLLLIDWEYAGVGAPYFDLAVVVRHHELSDAVAEYFLEAYLQRPPAPGELRHLFRQCVFYAFLLELWNLRVGGM